MRLAAILTAFSLAALPAGAAFGDDHHDDHHAETHAPAPAHRAPAPKFEAHAPGVHPKGATVHSHPIRVLAPRVVVHAKVGATWKHWEHPDFARPTYYWNWTSIHQVSCIAEDSYGDQYPVTEAAGRGFGLDNMTNVEDDALDRCHSESGADDTCYLASCSHF